MNIQNVTQRQFDNVMKREGIKVQDYYDATLEYDVFFRRNGRGTSPQGKLRLYYAQSTDMKIGTVFTLKGNNYIITSQDAGESDVYFTSIAVRCDTTFNVDGVDIPFVVASDKYSIARSQAITMTSGTVIIYTGLTDAVKKMDVNDYYENFGNAYAVRNTFINNNLYYAYLEQESKRTDKYTLTYNGVTSIDMSKTPTYLLSYIAKNNTTVIKDGVTLKYTVTPTDVATVSDTGLLTLLKDGTATVTATWTEQNVSCTTKITVTKDVEPSTAITATIGGSDIIKITKTKSWTVSFTDSNGATVSNFTDFEWKIVPTGFDISKFTTNTVNGTSITLGLPDDETLLDETFNLQIIQTSTSKVMAEKEISIMEGY